jgi:hypothetical protein
MIRYECDRCQTQAPANMRTGQAQKPDGWQYVKVRDVDATEPAARRELTVCARCDTQLGVIAMRYETLRV